MTKALEIIARDKVTVLDADGSTDPAEIPYEGEERPEAVIAVALVWATSTTPIRRPFTVRLIRRSPWISPPTTSSRPGPLLIPSPAALLS